MNKFLISVVDDELDITQLLNTILSDDYDVVEFNSPKKYLEYLSIPSNRKPDFLICDFDMPVMNGLDMVRKSHDNGHLIPFILLSGYLTKDNVLEALSYGVFTVLEKPIGVPALLKNIESLIKEHRLYSTHLEVRSIVKQLQEAYSHLTLMLEQYVPEEVLSRMIIENDPISGKVIKHTFTDLILSLEGRLHSHFKEQIELEEEKRQNKLF